MDTCHSGGCKGADVLFGEMAHTLGHKVRHYSFPGHKQYSLPEDLVVLSPLELAEADAHLRKAKKTLQKSYPCRWEYSNNLLRRNYRQVRDSQRIYAVSYLVDPYGDPDDVDCLHGVVGGGTGWAVTMGIDLGIKEVFFFDWELNRWYEFVSSFPVKGDQKQYVWYGLQPDGPPPVPYGDYAGIGSHDLPDNGAQAIRDLYQSR